MSFKINADLDQDYEDVVVPEDMYDLRIEQAEEKESEDGCDQIMVRISIQSADYPTAASIFHYLTAPGDDDDEAKTRTKMKFIMRFLNTFQVPMDGDSFEVEDLAGLTANSLVTVGEYNDAAKNELRLPAVESSAG